MTTLTTGTLATLATHMPLLLALTIRGTLVLALAWLLDRALRSRMSARSRRAWWILVPVAFLLPAGFPILPQLAQTPAPITATAIANTDIAWSGALNNTMTDSIAARTHDFPLVNALAALWFAGAMVYLLVVAVRTTRAWRETRRWTRTRLNTDPTLTNLLEECKTSAGVTARIGLVVSDAVPAPALLGWLRPQILLPATFMAARREQLRAILLHELAHFRARDIPLHWLHTLACAAHWFNPFAHLGARAWMRFREEAADESAISWLGGRDAAGATAATEYGDAFVEALKHSRAFSLPLGALVAGESNKNLKQRMIMILNHAQKTPRLALALALTTGLAAATALLPVRAADPQPAAAKTTPAKPKADSTSPDDVLLDKGWDLSEVGRHAEALAAFEEAAKLNPQNPRAHNNLGCQLIDMKRYDEGLAHCMEAIRLKPDYAEAHGNVAYGLSGLKRFAEAIPYYEKALSLMRKNDSTNLDRVLLNYGLALHEQERDPEARAAFEEAIVINPKNAPCLNNIGNYEFLAGNYAKSKEYYQRATEADPEFAEAWYDLGNAAIALGQSQGEAERNRSFAEAEQHYRHALKLSPNMTLAQDNLARLLSWMHRPDEAAVYFSKVIKENPDVIAKREAAKVFMQTGKTADAIPLLQEVLKQDPNNIEANYLLGNARNRTSDLDAAMESYRQTIRVNPFAVEPHGNLGSLLARAGRLDEAVAELETALKLKPDYAEAHHNLALVLTQQGRESEAHKHYEEAIRLRPAGIKASSSTEATATLPPPDIGQVFNLKDLDQQPRVRGIQAEPVYPAEMKRQGLSGEVVLTFIVDANGDVRNVSVVKSTNPAFEAPTIQAVQKWKFRPGKKDGKDVATKLTIPVTFRPSDEG